MRDYCTFLSRLVAASAAALMLAACGGGDADEPVPDTGPPRVGCDITPRPPSCA